MSRPQRKSTREVVEYFQTIDSDIEESDSDDDLSVPVSDADSSDEDVSDPGPSTSRGPPAKRRRPDGDAAAATGDWCQDLDGISRRVPFTGQPSFNIPDNIVRPIDFFLIIFTLDMVKIVKSETNRYAATELARRQLPPESLYKNWTTVTLRELKAFFAIWMHMALVKKPYLKDYWSKADILHSSFAGKLMSRNRFMQILGLLHLNDNATYIPFGQPGHDPLHKLRPIVDHLSRTFKALLTPQQKVVIDEGICPWRGKLRFRVYMKDKPNKWGIKLYMLCESSSAYVYDFEIYCAYPGLSNKPVDVCHRLMEPLLNRGYILYSDNYYTGPTLSQEMVSNGVMTVGTVRSNRVGMPKDLAALDLRQGQSAFRRKDKLVALRWQDKKPVNLLTMVHDPTKMVTVRSRAQEKIKPEAIQDYTLNMRGVDSSDQLMAYLPFNRRTLKWWKKLFVHLFTLIMIQASILYNKKQAAQGRPSLPISRFVKRLGEEMAEDALDPEEDANPPQMDRLQSRCCPDNIPSTDKKERPTRKCKVCVDKSKVPGSGVKRKETSYWCPNHKVPLCVTPCFTLYHTKKDYTK